MQQSSVWTGVAVVALLTTFAVDLLVPLGVAHATLYVLVVLLAIPTRSKTTVIALTLGSTFLGSLAFAIQFPPAPAIPVGYAIANRALSVLGIAVTAALGIFLIEHWHRLSRTREKVDEQGQLLDMAGRIARFGAWSYVHDSEQIVWSDEIARIVEVEPGHTPTLDEAIERCAPEYRDKVRQAVRRCIEQGTAWDEEWELLTATGQRRWVRAIGEAVRDESGRITGAQGAFQDIDARKRAEASAEHHRARLRQMAESMPMLVWNADSEGQIDFLNQRVLDYTGTAEQSELLGDQWLKIIHPEDQERTLAMWIRSVETGTPYSFEFRIRDANGNYRWFQTSAIPMLDRDDKVEHWFGACVDIHAKRELSARLVQTLENMSDIFYAYDRDWRLVYANAAGERLAGRNRDEMIGQVIWTTFPETRGTVLETEYRKVVESRQPKAFVTHYEPLDVWLEVSAYPDDDGLAVYIRDITRQRKAEEQLRQAQRLETVGQLTGGIAHDFN
ncbi:MAG: PAS domain S-box protein, partial [Xanthomonadaceae bacterium]|nr:PAS domain S-box protein [Xanthomonadaceae bacterium]